MIHEQQLKKQIQTHFLRIYFQMNFFPSSLFIIVFSFIKIETFSISLFKNVFTNVFYTKNIFFLISISPKKIKNILSKTTEHFSLTKNQVGTT